MYGWKNGAWTELDASSKVNIVDGNILKRNGNSWCKAIAIDKTLYVTEIDTTGAGKLVTDSAVISYVAQEINKLGKLELVVVDELPPADETTLGKIYLVSKEGKTGYTEHITVKGGTESSPTYAWEEIGDTDVDLSNYYTKTEVDSLLSNKVEKVDGKGLSTEDFTNAYKTKLEGISEGANKVEASTINGNIKIDGTEVNVYTHPEEDPSYTTIKVGTVEAKATSTNKTLELTGGTGISLEAKTASDGGPKVIINATGTEAQPATVDTPVKNEDGDVVDVGIEASKIADSKEIEFGSGFNVIEDERKFYEIYDSLKDQLTDAENFFGNKMQYTLKYWFTDINGDSAWVIPSTLIYIPTEWGGCKGDEVIGTINNDIDPDETPIDIEITPISLHVDSKYCRWDISKYGSDYKAVTNNVIASFVDFYSSRFIAKCVHIGSGTTYYYDGKDAENHFETFNGNNFIYWNIGKALMIPGEYKWTIYMFMPNNPNAIIQPEFDDNGIITPGDYYQVYNKDGVNYTGTFIVPDVDVSLSTVVLDDWDEERSSFTWNCLGKEIDPVTHEESEEKIVNEYVDDWTITIGDYPPFTCNPINLQGEVTLSLPQIEEYIGEKLEPGIYDFTVVANRDDKQSSPATKQFEITPEGSDEITWCNLNNQYYHGIIVNFENSFTLNNIEAYQTDRGWTGPRVYVGKIGAFREAKQFLIAYREKIKDDFLTDARIDKYIAMLDAADAIQYATEEDYFYTAPESNNEDLDDLEERVSTVEDSTASIDDKLNNLQFIQTVMYGTDDEDIPDEPYNINATGLTLNRKYNDSDDIEIVEITKWDVKNQDDELSWRKLNHDEYYTKIGVDNLLDKFDALPSMDEAAQGDVLTVTVDGDNKKAEWKTSSNNDSIIRDLILNATWDDDVGYVFPENAQSPTKENDKLFVLYNMEYDDYGIGWRQPTYFDIKPYIAQKNTKGHLFWFDIPYQTYSVYTKRGIDNMYWNEHVVSKRQKMYGTWQEPFEIPTANMNFKIVHVNTDGYNNHVTLKGKYWGKADDEPQAEEKESILGSLIPDFQNYQYSNKLISIKPVLDDDDQFVCNVIDFTDIDGDKETGIQVNNLKIQNLNATPYYFYKDDVVVTASVNSLCSSKRWNDATMQQFDGDTSKLNFLRASNLNFERDSLFIEVEIANGNTFDPVMLTTYTWCFKVLTKNTQPLPRFNNIIDGYAIAELITSYPFSPSEADHIHINGDVPDLTYTCLATHPFYTSTSITAIKGSKDGKHVPCTMIFNGQRSLKDTAGNKFVHNVIKAESTNQRQLPEYSTSCFGTDNKVPNTSSEYWTQADFPGLIMAYCGDDDNDGIYGFEGKIVFKTQTILKISESDNLKDEESNNIADYITEVKL
ncbi:unnamed protein product [Cylicocyclus nassatus]|uniref:Uncharacterized protein n=1 Tax=Cylicocyclus nassatus TaxID=53992 RepID=A0AA36HH58_CYLNA|nr:unnamed protein product [Cylicocyclus nassatus]